jgi:hypothetical protein
MLLKYALPPLAVWDRRATPMLTRRHSRAAPLRRRWPSACGAAAPRADTVGRRETLLCLACCTTPLLQSPGRPRADAAEVPARPDRQQPQADAYALSLPSGNDVLADVWAPGPAAAAAPRLLPFSPGFLVERAAYRSLYEALAGQG